MVGLAAVGGVVADQRDRFSVLLAARRVVGRAKGLFADGGDGDRGDPVRLAGR